jgi:hypothetical protein
MYKNQYVISASAELKTSIQPVKWQGLNIYPGPSLNIVTASFQEINILLLGLLIDPFHPDDSDQQILDRLAKNCQDKDQFLINIHELSGRYIFLYKNQNEFITVGDTFNIKHCYFGFPEGNLLLTSSPKMFLDLFNYKLLMSDQKKDFVSSSQFIKKESAWFGNQCEDDRLTKLLPNHYLNIENHGTERFPLRSPDGISSEDEVIAYAGKVLTGTFKAISQRQNLVQALTAGWDSRILLAASKTVSKALKYFVFNRGHGVDHPDIRIAKNLSEKLGLNFSIIKPPHLNNEFLDSYKREHIYPRVLTNTQNIQYHYNNKEKNYINLNGNGAEVVRCFYGYSRRTISKNMLYAFAGYPNNRFIQSEINSWYEEAKVYSKQHNIPLIDLFYWEQRMGNWGARYPFEQDIAIEEFSPFNNRSLILALMKINPKERRYPDFKFIYKLIQSLWPETLSEPINPENNFIKKTAKGIISGNSQFLYWSKKAEFIIGK